MVKLKKLVTSIILFSTISCWAQTFVSKSKLEIESFNWADLGLVEAQDFQNPLIVALNDWLIKHEVKTVDNFKFDILIKKNQSSTEAWDKIWNFKIEVELKRLNSSQETICEKKFESFPLKIRFDDFKSFNSALASTLFKELIKDTQYLLEKCNVQVGKSISLETSFSYSEAMGFCQKVLTEGKLDCKVDSFGQQKTVINISKISSIESASEIFLKLGYNLESVKEDYFKLQRK
jgi:hypothetical protein